MLSLLKFVVLGFVINNAIMYGMMQQPPRDMFFIIAFHGDGILKNKLRQTRKYYANNFRMDNNYFVMNLNVDSITKIDKQIILFKALWTQDRGNDKQKRMKQAVIGRYKSLCNNNEENVIKIENFFVKYDSNILNDTFFKNEITFEGIKNSKNFIVSCYKDLGDLFDGKIEAKKDFFKSAEGNPSAKNTPPIIEVLPFLLLYNNNSDSILTDLVFIMRPFCEEWNNEEKRKRSWFFLLRLAMISDREKIFTILLTEDHFKTKHICSIDNYKAMYSVLKDQTDLNDNDKKTKYLNLFMNTLMKNNIDVHSETECVLF